MKNDAAAQGGDNIRVDADKLAPTRPPFKVELALFTILSRGATGINQPEAHEAYRESCLHSTISQLKNGSGISFTAFADLDTVRYFNQKPFNRYWLTRDSDRIKAENLLNHYRQKRGLGKLEFAPWHDTDKKSA